MLLLFRRWISTSTAESCWGGDLGILALCVKIGIACQHNIINLALDVGRTALHVKFGVGFLNPLPKRGGGERLGFGDVPFSLTCRWCIAPSFGCVCVRTRCVN